MSDFTISKIEPQKKRKNRFSIFANKEFKIGISTDTLLKFELQTGKTITPDLLLKIQDNEDYISLKESALRYIARRPHSIKELKDKLFIKSKNAQSINKIIEEFQAVNYLDDESFAFAFLTDEMRLKKSGPLLIKNKLLQKGVSVDTIDSLIENNYNIPNQIENCNLLANKKIIGMNKKFSIPEKKSKLANYLKQKGYHWEIVKQVIEPLINGENDEE